MGEGVGAAAAVQPACLPPDTSVDVVTTEESFDHLYLFN